MKILIVDDEKNLRQVLAIELATDGDEVDTAEDGVKALDLLEHAEYDVVLLDLNMPRLGGIEVLKKIRALDIPVEVIILTANTTVSVAVEAMKLGAYDYLTKPFRLEELSPIIEKALEKKKLRSENLILKTQIERQQDRRSIVAKSPAMLELLETVGKIAASDYPVLITGESGVGKELIASSIRAGSKRPDKPFVALNCGAIPENMIESELFGYEKGAFTGAQAQKLGLLEVANTGTLFLDEIGDMPLALQVKLLRVIETGAFFRLGGIREKKVDIRIVAATNKDLKAGIVQGSFRQDLYYRISSFIVHILPLRDRPEDIPVLLDHFIKRAPEFRRKRFSKEALAVLSRYSWPGNVRELQNVLNRTLLLSKNDVIEPSDLPLDICGMQQSGSARLEDMEREHILKVLKASAGQRNRAAEALGIDPKTLYRKLSGYGVKE
jgi:two-component system response regulator AtoC